MVNHATFGTQRPFAHGSCEEDVERDRKDEALWDQGVCREERGVVERLEVDRTVDRVRGVEELLTHLELDDRSTLGDLE